MALGSTEKKRFSIFDSVITHKHREFYEEIAGELNVIIPVCNHGKSLAVDIGTTAHDQGTLRELMDRVETFRGDLMASIKNLFGQSYSAKEAFYQMILSTLAYGKINTIDRNLLERTCDVRWWALETAFGDCLTSVSRARVQLSSLADEIDRSVAGATGSSRQPLREFRERYLASMNLLFDAELLAGALNEIRILDALAETNGLQVLEACRQTQERIQFACERLEDINSSYTLYRDLVLCDSDGLVVASANRTNRSQVLGLTVSDEAWFGRAMATDDGDDYFAQDVTSSKLEDGEQSLIYATAVREGSQVKGRPIGALGICFDFRGEAEIILNDHLPTDDEGRVEDGWYTFLSSQNGTVIASNDEVMFETGQRVGLPRSHRQLTPGRSCCSYGVYGGRESGVFTSLTDGYLDYKGLGWSSHLVTLKETVFMDQSHELQEANIDMKELMASRINPEINQLTYQKVQKDKSSIKLVLYNGIIFAAKLGSRGRLLEPVFEQVTKTGEFAIQCMETLLQEMAFDELALNFKMLKMFSRQAIDLIDRNLFERAADIRWWSTDRFFWEALENPSPEAFMKAGQRLKVINNSYTMYRNLVLANSDGEIVACSDAARLSQLRQTPVSGHEWFMKGRQTGSASQFAVQDVQDSELEPEHQASLIYAGGIRRGGARQGAAIGVLGVLFDWDTEARQMLECCIPRQPDGSYIEGSAAFYTNREGRVIETSSPEEFPVGGMMNLPEVCAGLDAGQSASGFFLHGGKKYLIGSTRTKGYREYRGLAWCAHVVRPF